jgi:hypothetical protein
MREGKLIKVLGDSSGNIAKVRLKPGGRKFGWNRKIFGANRDWREKAARRR